MKEFLAALPNIISSVALTIAGVWAYFRIRRERTHTPHIELDLDCQLLGPHQGEYLAEIIVFVNNKGLVRQDFQSMKLRIRGIAENTPFEFYSECRVNAPVRILDTDIIKKQDKENFLFVEPGVRHLITYATKIPVTDLESQSRIKYLFIRTRFYYQDKTPHSIERVFSIEQCLNQAKPIGLQNVV